MDDITHILPPMLTGPELKQALMTLPEIKPNIHALTPSERLIALNDIYDVYYPFTMSGEIYSKLYLALSRSLQKKNTRQAVMQLCENRKAVIGSANYSGIIGGSDSFTILGCSGIGKSTAIAKAISLLRGNEIATIQNPYCKIVPVLVIQCPWDSSVKGLLLEILRKTDEVLKTKYYENALRARLTTDNLIGSVSTVCLNHIGLLVLDEIQNVANSKNGKNLIGSMTQLINNSGISISMVGTPESAPFFEQDYKLARRSLGLKYDTIPFDSDFVLFCETLYKYQYTARRTPLTDAIVEWLYSHSNGVTSNVVSLVHDAQEIAIMDGSEELSLLTLTKAYQQRLGLLHDYLENPVLAPKSVPAEPLPEETPEHQTPVEEDVLAAAAAEAKKQNCSLVSLIYNKITVVEVEP